MHTTIPILVRFFIFKFRFSLTFILFDLRLISLRGASLSLLLIITSKTFSLHKVWLRLTLATQLIMFKPIRCPTPSSLILFPLKLMDLVLFLFVWLSIFVTTV